MPTIFDYIERSSDKHRERAREIFLNRLAECTSKDEERQLEMELLLPDDLPDMPIHVTKRPWGPECTLYFETKEDYELFASAFDVSTYNRPNAHKIGALLKLCKLLLTGQVKYQVHTDNLIVLVGGKRYVF